MKRIMLTIAVCAFTFISNAQRMPSTEKVELTPKERATKVANKLQSSLGLTEDIREKVLALNIERFTALNGLRKQYGPEIKMHKKELGDVKGQYMSQLEKLLTAEQLEKFKAKSANRKAKGKKATMKPGM